MEHSTFDLEVQVEWLAQVITLNLMRYLSTLTNLVPTVQGMARLARVYCTYITILSPVAG